LVFVLLASFADGQAQLRDTVCFGDSLTHNDLLGWVYGNAQDMYGADPMEAAFNKGAKTGDELRSYAVGGSESDDLEIQVNVYLLDWLLGNADQATLFCIEIGANDILNNDPLLGANPPGVDPVADALIDSIVSNITSNLSTLWLSSPNAQFVIWTIPDVTVTPDLWGKSPLQRDNIRAHVQRANQSLRAFGALPSVAVVDVYWSLRRAALHPPVLFGRSLVGPPMSTGYDHIFADELHFTAVTNALTACEIIYEMNSVFSDTIPAYTNRELAELARLPRY
jgi:lysophospholipase L1-like esterase